MAYSHVWARAAEEQYRKLREDARASLKARMSDKKTKATQSEGLFKQVHGCIGKLLNNPRHPGLKTHKYDSLENPFDRNDPVFEAYVQNQTPGAYRVFWCYCPGKGQITILAITPHPQEMVRRSGGDGFGGSRVCARLTYGPYRLMSVKPT